MIENYKISIAALLQKIGGSDTESDDFYKTIDDDYRKIDYCVNNKQEDLQIISDLLHNDSINKSDAVGGQKLLNKQMDIINACSSIQSGLWNQLEQALIPHQINHGKWLFENGRIQESLSAWEEVLKHEPHNDYIHSKLKDIIHLNNRSKKTAEDFDQKYHFRYLGSFGNTILKSPCSIIASESDKHLFVSDYDTNQIHKFDYDGKSLGVLSIELKYPMGLFRDNSNLFWICDFGNSRLVAVNFDGRQINEINLKNIVDCNDDVTHPAFGCVMHDQFYLILRNSDHGKRHLVTFNKNYPDDSLKILTHSTPMLLGSINIIKNKLYAGMINIGYSHTYPFGDEQNGLYEYDFGENQSKLLKGNYYSHLMRQFVQWNNNLFMTCGESLVKLSIDGTQHFAVNLSLIFGFASMPTGLTVIERNNRSVLLITDTINNCVHQLLI